MSEPTLIDTNVLVYSCLEEDSRYQACRAVLAEARSPDGNLCVVQQILTEFYAVITNRKQVTACFEPDEALAEIDNYLAAPGITLLTQPADLTTRTLGLLRRARVRGHAVYDLQIAAVALGNGVSRILTYDRANFGKFSELTVVEPKAHGEAG